MSYSWKKKQMNSFIHFLIICIQLLLFLLLFTLKSFSQLR